jgi:hypothetical protein
MAATGTARILLSEPADHALQRRPRRTPRCPRTVRLSATSGGTRAHLVADEVNSTGRLLTGRCMCGAVRYRVADEFLYALNCHCSNCRRATGSAFKPFAGIERSKLRLTQGDTNLLIFGGPNAYDAHCKTCGSLLHSVVRDGAFVHVTLGTLVDTPTIRPTAHIFVGSKAPWFTITDLLPQHEEFG